MPHCNDGLMIVFAVLYFFVGGLTSSPATSPSWAAMWDRLCFPLVVPPVYLLPDIMLLKLLGDTLNSVHASFAVPSFIYFHLKHNHRAATSSLVGLFLGLCTILAESEWGSSFFSNFCLTSSAVEAGVLYRAQISVRDVDLD